MIFSSFTDGYIAKKTHIQYLICLYYIYATLEDLLDTHSAHPCIGPIYSPGILARAPALQEDIRYFLDLEAGSDWRQLLDVKGKGRARFDARLSQKTEDALGEYVDRLQAIGTQSSQTQRKPSEPYNYTPPIITSPGLLAAHAYVRYMGDLSGGQEIRRSVVAAYSLPIDAADGHSHSIEGQRYYHFGKESSRSEIKAFKRSLRHGLDCIGQDISADLAGRSPF